MIKNKTAVVGVLYPSAKPFIYSYINSLDNQTYKQFDLILMNDGIDNPQSFFKNSVLSPTIYDAHGTPAKIRLDLIRKTLDLGYNYIIFTDCDDYFSENRIEILILKLIDNDIVINDLDIISEDNSLSEKLYLSNRITNEAEISSKNILSCNMMGLTNTASNSLVLKKCLPFMEVDVIAFDWLLWTYALNFGFKAIFTSDTSTKYRVYSGNVAGLPQIIGKKEVLHELDIKIAHYRQLINLGIEYEKLYNIFLELQKNSLDLDWFDNYISTLEANKVSKPMWWENVKIFKE